MLRNLIYFVILALSINSFAVAASAQSGVKGKWKLVSMIERPDKEVTPADGLITLNIQSRSLGGNGGCNTYGGDYKIVGKKIKIKDVVSTMMACDNLQIEQTYFGLLGKSVSYSVIGKSLIFKDKNGRVVLRFYNAETEDEQTGIKGKWKAVFLMEKPDAEIIPEDGTVTLNIQSKTLSGTGGCNHFSGEYKIDGRNIKIKQLATTEMDCHKVHYDFVYSNLLDKSASYTLKGQNLIFKDKSGRAILKFTRA